MTLKILLLIKKTTRKKKINKRAECKLDLYLARSAVFSGIVCITSAFNFFLLFSRTRECLVWLSSSKDNYIEIKKSDAFV